MSKSKHNAAINAFDKKIQFLPPCLEFEGAFL